jgi:hypothetical protein
MDFLNPTYFNVLSVLHVLTDGIVEVLLWTRVYENGQWLMEYTHPCLLLLTTSFKHKVWKRDNRYPGETSFGMRVNYNNIFNKKVMRYGRTLWQDLRSLDELKILDLLCYRLIFLLMRFNYYPNVSVTKELFFFQIYVQNDLNLNKTHSCNLSS